MTAKLYSSMKELKLVSNKSFNLLQPTVIHSLKLGLEFIPDCDLIYGFYKLAFTNPKDGVSSIYFCCDLLLTFHSWTTLDYPDT